MRKITTLKRGLAILPLFALLLLTSCGGNNQQAAKEQVFDENLISTLPEINVEDFPEAEPVMLSELIEDFKIVRLESENPEALLSSGPMIFSSKNYIAAGEFSKPTKLFDKKSGKFIRNIGAIGRGPGEYNMPMLNIIINEETKKIYLNPFASTDLMEYNLESGEYIKTIKNKNIPDKRSVKYDIIDDEIVAFFTPRNGDSLIAVNTSLKDGSVTKLLNNFIGEVELNGSLSNITGDNKEKSILYKGVSSPIVIDYNIKEKSYYAPFKLGDSFSVKDEKSKFMGYWRCFLLRIGDKYLIDNCKYKTTPNEHGSTLTKTLENFLIMDKDLSNKKRAKILIDPFFGIESYPYVYNGELQIALSAITLKDKIIEKIEEGSLSKDEETKAKEFVKSIDDEDNYIILYGKVK